MSELCPVHCINAACKDPDFMEKNQTFLLTVLGLGSSGLAVVFAYFLKSRCRKIKLLWGCLICDRTPLTEKTDKIEPKDITINSDSVEISEIDQP
jgi:hypothetical protein